MKGFVLLPDRTGEECLVNTRFIVVVAPHAGGTQTEMLMEGTGGTTDILPIPYAEARGRIVRATTP